MSDPTNEDLAKAAVAADLAEDQQDSAAKAEADQEAHDDLVEAVESAYDKAQAENPNFNPTDMYSRVNTAHGGGAASVVRQNPVTFADDIQRVGVPGDITDPRSEAEPEKPSESTERNDTADSDQTLVAGSDIPMGSTPEEIIARNPADDGAGNAALGAQSKGANFDGATSESLAQAGEDLGGGESPEGDDEDDEDEDPAEKADADLTDDDYNRVTVAQLKERLDASGTEYSSSDTKPDLWKLVTGRTHKG